MASKQVRLVSYSGEEIFTAEVKIDGVESIIFSNQVYLFRQSEGQIDVYREVTAERVRERKTLRTDFFTAQHSARRENHGR